jgi:hypothetical protein
MDNFFRTRRVVHVEYDEMVALLLFPRLGRVRAGAHPQHQQKHRGFFHRSPEGYFTIMFNSNIGSIIAITMNPTITPITSIIKGSISEVMMRICSSVSRS